VKVRVDVGVNVRVDVGVKVRVDVGVNVAVNVGVKVGVGIGPAGRTGTAPIAQERPTAEPSVQDIVTEAAPGSVLPAPTTSLGEPPVV
jgi:hypothetical protein